MQFEFHSLPTTGAKSKKTKNASTAFPVLPIFVLSLFNKKEEKEKNKTHLVMSHWPQHLQESFKNLKQNDQYKGNLGEMFSFTTTEGMRLFVVGLGEKSELAWEHLRKEIAKMLKALCNDYQTISLNFDSFVLKNNEAQTAKVISESLLLTDYGFDKYQTVKRKSQVKKIDFYSEANAKKVKEMMGAIEESEMLASSINLARNFINEPPNVLQSESYAKMIEADAKKLKRVKIKILGKKELQKEEMNMLLAVNAGSAYDPRVVHLTYTPAKVTAKTKHIALVGKGLTFDTGGYSLKPGGSMMGMKFDMAGSATVYAAFRAIALMGADVQVSCFLGITDNAVSSLATMPDSVIKARSGKMVEILNTDAEGRLVLGDVLDYACDQKPDVVIDAATLTGAMLVSLGTEVCGFFANDDKLSDHLMKAAKEVNEYLWRMPIVQEYRDDIKSQVADIKNIGTAGNAGSAKGAVFLEHFIKKGVAWAHLDIAGVAGDQAYLPYCPAKGASGIMVRTLVQYILNSK